MKLKSVGKFLDQPLLINSISNKMPSLLTGAAVVYGLKNTLSVPKDERKKQAIKNTIILTSITAFSLLGSKLIKVNDEKLIETVAKGDILAQQNKAINNFLSINENLSSTTSNILQNARKRMLSLKETDLLLDGIKNANNNKSLASVLFGEKKNICSKEILGEISKLSIMGFIPVVSGIFGGIIADKVTNENDNCKEKIINKLKEGLYQFFANIFLCNVGAGVFLYLAEGLNKSGVIKNLTPLKKTLAILSGIMCVGVLGGNCIANFISNKFLNPLTDVFIKNNNPKCSERKPEPLDILLHTDDIATAGVLSGIKWIEPLLPIMYLISGYRSAIGYRNGKNYRIDKGNKNKHN